MITYVPVLNREQCEAVSAKVLALRKLWVLRELWIDQPKDHPYYSLGANCSFEVFKKGSVPRDTPQYRRDVTRSNPVLGKNFSELYSCLKTSLEKHLGQEVIYEKTLAYPGFHIYCYDPVFSKPLGLTHVDLNHSLLSWKDVEKQPKIVFTLALKLPKSGSGIHMKNFKKIDHFGESPKGFRYLLNNAPTVFFPYVTGYMVLHKGDYYHDTVPSLGMRKNEHRITLQGYGVYWKNAWRLFW